MTAVNPRLWSRLRFLLERALELDGQARSDYVASLEGEDTTLRSDLVRLLDEHDRLDQRSVANAMDLATPALADALREDMALDNDRIGQEIGPYRLIGLLGAGGMGAVYLAERSGEGFSQRVALKVVRKALGSATAYDRFERERQILAGLKDPGIAQLFDGGRTADGQSFYTMEYVDGEVVTDYCHVRLDSVAARVRLLLQIASALASAHRSLIVHRDIKPSNILVNADGQVKLLDFGLAKLLDNPTLPTMTQAGIGPMTPAYAAPEQFHNGAITVATDVYQFAVLCFVVLAERLPYQADPADSLEWARAVTEQEPMSLARAFESRAEAQADPASARRYKRQLTRDLDAIVRKALAKEPTERYGSMDAMIADLHALLDGRPVAAQRAGPAYFAWRFVLRHRYAVAGALLAFVSLSATALLALQQSRVAGAEAARANAVADFLVGLFRVSDPGVNRGERLNADQILQQGAQRIEREMASQPEQQARLQSVIGEVYAILGDYPRASAAFKPAIATLKASASADPADLANALNWMAHIATVQGDLKGALAVLDEAESKLDGSTRRQREVLATVHGRRAAALNYLGDYDRSRREYETSLALREKIGPPYDLRVVGAHNNFGNLLRQLNDLKGAQTEYRKALAMCKEIYGTDSDKVYMSAGANMNLGMVLIELGDLTEARASLEKASRFFAAMDGPPNAGYANAEDKLGEIDKLERKFDEAFEHYEKSEQAYREALGEHHSFVALPIQNKGQAELERGDPDAALKQFERALALRLESLPRSHPQVATSLDGRSQALLGLNRTDEAKRDAEEALAIRRQALPSDHPLIVYSLLHVGLTRFALEDADGARVALREAEERAPRAFSYNEVRLNLILDAIHNPRASMLTPVPLDSYDE